MTAVSQSSDYYEYYDRRYPQAQAHPNLPSRSSTLPADLLGPRTLPPSNIADRYQRNYVASHVSNQNDILSRTTAVPTPYPGPTPYSFPVPELPHHSGQLSSMHRSQQRSTGMY